MKMTSEAVKSSIAIASNPKALRQLIDKLDNS